MDMILLCLISVALVIYGIAQACRPDLALFGERWALRHGSRAELSDSGRAWARFGGVFWAVLGASGIFVAVGSTLHERAIEQGTVRGNAVTEVWGSGSAGVGKNYLDGFDVLAPGDVPVTARDTAPTPVDGLVATLRYGVVGSDLDPSVVVDDVLVVDPGDLPPGTVVIGLPTRSACTLTGVLVAESQEQVVITPTYRWVEGEEPESHVYLGTVYEPATAAEGCPVNVLGTGYVLLPVSVEEPLGNRVVIDGRTGEPAQPVRSDG